MDPPQCKNFSRAYIHLIAGKEQTGARLITIHNIAYMMRLMKRARAAIDEGNYPEFVVDYMARVYPKADYPGWVKDALTEVGINLREATPAAE